MGASKETQKDGYDTGLTAILRVSCDEGDSIWPAKKIGVPEDFGKSCIWQSKHTCLLKMIEKLVQYNFYSISVPLSFSQIHLCLFILPHYIPLK